MGVAQTVLRGTRCSEDSDQHQLLSGKRNRWSHEGQKPRFPACIDLKDHVVREDLWHYSYKWEVRPVAQTNLWLALDYNHSSHQPAVNGTNRFDSDVLMKIYIFNPRQVVLQRELTAYAPWHHNDTILDWRFDESNQRLTYFTTNGYAAFDLQQNTITPCPPPPGQPARTIKDYGGHPAGWTPGWEPQK